ncbi:MAG TPA: hypothetical protein VK791_04360 [bacterium]|nr:hypothetical protein [bacterium]
MPISIELQNQWEAFLKLLQVREPKLYEHLKVGRIKEVTKYNLMVYAQTPDDLRELEVGIKVYHDKVDEFLPLIFGTTRGIKTELSSEEDWEAAKPVENPAAAVYSAPTSAPVAAVPSVPIVNLGSDQNELLKVLESSIRQKLETEIRQQMQAEVASPEAQEQVAQKVREEFQAEENNRRLAVRMALIAEGDNTLTQMVIAWQQAKQSGEGGEQWKEVKQRLLDLLDATVQLTNS